MDELLARLEEKAGVGPEAGRKAIQTILSYLDKNAPAEKMAPLYAAIPGARELAGEKKGGGLFSILGGGLMGVYAQLTAAGLSSTQMQAAGNEILAFAREKLGDAAVDDIANSVPAIRQLL
ncbi:MAG: DUF2267 domain-containing protein [Bauldia sp.]|nr:DUF2267 domain-containing protein [Bauldia sp.]